MLTPIDLKSLSEKHPDAFLTFSLIVGSMEKFKRKTIADFDFFYFFPDKPKKAAKVTPVPTSMMPAERKFQDFLEIIDKHRRVHVGDSSDFEELKDHPENTPGVFQGASGIAIHMTQRGFPGQFVLIESFPLLNDPRDTKKSK